MRPPMPSSQADNRLTASMIARQRAAHTDHSSRPGIIGHPSAAFLSAALIGSVVALAALAMPASAHAQPANQSQPERPITYLTITGDQPVHLRCGSQDIWYAVTQVPPGTVLAADQRLGSGWWAVAYPAGVPVVVPVEEGKQDEPGGPIELIEPSTLKAYNASDPVREESYRRVLSDQLPAGTTFRYIRTINGRDGAVGGYLVHPPKQARLWVDGRSVREATQPEIDAYRAAEAARIQRENPPAPEPTPEPEKPQAPETPSEEEAPASSTDQPAPQPTELAQPPAEPAGQAESDDATPVVAPAPVDPARIAAQRVNALDKSLETTIRAPLESAEFDQLIAQYQEVAAGLTPESDPDGALAVAIAERVNLLNLRSELQATRRELIAIREADTAADQQVRILLEQVRATRRYAVVGRLSTSTVYDGVALPRLLRIVSIEGERGRTLAYLALQEGQDFTTLLGQIVGVAAPAATESNARVPILVPANIDLLDATKR